MKKRFSLMISALIFVSMISMLSAPVDGIPMDVNPPTLTILAPSLVPTADPTGMFDAYFSLTTSNMVVAFSGTAWDDNELADVEWTDIITGTSGYAVGTTTWVTPSIALAGGLNLIVIVAFDTSGNAYAVGVEITRTAPATPGAPTITLSDSSGSQVTTDDEITISGSAYDSTDDYRITWENTANGATGTCTESSPWDGGRTGGWSADIPLRPGENVIRFTVTDEYGCATTVTVIITYLTDGAPEDDGCCHLFGICCDLLLEIAIIMVIVGAVIALAPLPFPPIVKKIGWVVLIIGIVLLIVVLVCIFGLIQAAPE